MSKDNKGKNNNIVFVNSFKGGTGKTYISLSLCISAALENKDQEQYNKIFYFDIDILGTGASYKLFAEETKDINYFDYDYTKKSWYGVCYDITLGIDGESGSFNAICINPKLRIKKTNYENTVIKTNSSEEQRFIGSVINFIEESANEGKHNLYIFDCSPGFNKIERNLISKFDSKVGFDVKEVFVTSYDSSHVEKTVECLKEYYSVKTPLKIQNETLENVEGLYNENVNQYIALNDIHDLKNMKRNNGDKINLDFNSAKDKIKELFNNGGDKTNNYNELYNIFEIKYNQSMCSSNLLTLRVGIKGSYEDYNITTNDLYKRVVNNENTGK